jgi:DNA-binding transcriptional ArsR family regulator
MAVHVDAERIRFRRRRGRTIAAGTANQVRSVSHPLKLLREAGLVESQREGRFILYRLAPGAYVASKSGPVDHLDVGCCWPAIPKEAPRGKQTVQLKSQFRDG